MSRGKPGPWYRRDRGRWYATIGKQQVPLPVFDPRDEARRVRSIPRPAFSGNSDNRQTTGQPRGAAGPEVPGCDHASNLGPHAGRLQDLSEPIRRRAWFCASGTDRPPGNRATGEAPRMVGFDPSELSLVCSGVSAMVRPKGSSTRPAIEGKPRGRHRDFCRASRSHPAARRAATSISYAGSCGRWAADRWKRLACLSNRSIGRQGQPG